LGARSAPSVTCQLRGLVVAGARGAVSVVMSVLLRVV